MVLFLNFHLQRFKEVQVTLHSPLQSLEILDPLPPFSPPILILPSLSSFYRCVVTFVTTGMLVRFRLIVYSIHLYYSFILLCMREKFILIYGFNTHRFDRTWVPTLHLKGLKDLGGSSLSTIQDIWFNVKLLLPRHIASNWPIPRSN